MAEDEEHKACGHADQCGDQQGAAQVAGVAQGSRTAKDRQPAKRGHRERCAQSDQSGRKPVRRRFGLGGLAAQPGPQALDAQQVDALEGQDKGERQRRCPRMPYEYEGQGCAVQVQEEKGEQEGEDVGERRTPAAVRGGSRYECQEKEPDRPSREGHDGGQTSQKCGVVGQTSPTPVPRSHGRCHHCSTPAPRQLRSTACKQERAYWRDRSSVAGNTCCCCFRERCGASGWPSPPSCCP